MNSENGARVWGSFVAIAHLSLGLGVLALAPLSALLQQALHDGLVRALSLAALLLPGTVVMTLPLAVFLLVSLCPNVAIRHAVVSSGLAAVVSIMLSGWIVPAINASLPDASTVAGVRETSLSMLMVTPGPTAQAEVLLRLSLSAGCLVAAFIGVAARAAVPRMARRAAGRSASRHG